MIFTAPHPAPATSIHLSGLQAKLDISTDTTQITLPTLKRFDSQGNNVTTGQVNFFNRTLNFDYPLDIDEEAQEGINATYVKGNVVYKIWWSVGSYNLNSTVTVYPTTNPIKAGDVVTFATVYDYAKAKYTLTVADTTQNWQVNIIKPSKCKPTGNVLDVKATYSAGVAATVKQPLPRLMNPVKFWFEPNGERAIYELPNFIISGNWIYVL